MSLPADKRSGDAADGGLRRPYPTGLVLALLLTAIAKSIFLGSQISASWGPPAALILIPELGVVATVMLIAAVSPRSLPLRALSVALLGAIVGLYVLDSCVELSLFDRLSLSDLARYRGEARTALDFFGPEQFILAACIIYAVFSFREPISIKTRRTIAVGAMAVFSLTWIPGPEYPFAMRKLSTSVLSIFREPFVLGDATNRYDEQLARRAADELLDERRFNAPPGLPHLIILFVESLSAASSKKLSGLANDVPAFDELAANGTLFDRFFANGSNTEGGLISVLNGMPPLPVIGGSPFLFDEYADHPSAVADARALGYRVEFLSTASLDFLGMKDYLRRIGFERVEGVEEVPRFRNAPKYVFHAPPDEVLYDEAIARLPGLMRDRPMFLALLTVSGHKPYLDPRTGETSEKSVLRYETEELARFHRALEQNGFYEHGILIVFGDHRRMTPVSEAEWKRYGDSAVVRVPLLVVGKGVRRGVVDHRFLQQADLLPLLPAVISGTGLLSSHAVFREPDRRYGRSAQGRLALFSPDNGGQRAAMIGLRGAVLEPLTPPIPRLPQLVDALHRQRAALQHLRANGRRTCTFTVPTLGDPSSEQGLRADLFKGSELNDDLSASSPRFVSTKVIAVPTLEAAGPELPRYHFALQLSAFLKVEAPGLYYLRTISDDGACLAIDGRIVIDSNRMQSARTMGAALVLEPGLHPFVLRYSQAQGNRTLSVSWVKADETRDSLKDGLQLRRAEPIRFEPIGEDSFVAPSR